MNDNYETVNADGKMILFVNSLESPHDMIPLDHYRHSIDIEQKIRFFRLYKVVYLQTSGGAGITHSLLQWHEVMVKTHCKDAMKNHIDAGKGVKEFLI